MDWCLRINHQQVKNFQKSSYINFFKPAFKLHKFMSTNIIKHYLCVISLQLINDAMNIKKIPTSLFLVEIKMQLAKSNLDP